MALKLVEQAIAAGLAAHKLWQNNRCAVELNGRPDPLGSLRNLQKFELDRNLIVSDLAQSADDAWVNGLLPVPSDSIYFEFADRGGTDCGLLVNFDRDASVAALTGVMVLEGESFPWFMYGYVRDGDLRQQTVGGPWLRSLINAGMPAEDVAKVSRLFLDAFKCLCMALSCKDIDAVHIGPTDRVKHKREVRGLPPLDEYRRLTVKHHVGKYALDIDRKLSDLDRDRAAAYREVRHG